MSDGLPAVFGLFGLDKVRHFEKASNDDQRNYTERQTYRGLCDRLKSPEFLCDLGLMYDTLHELSIVSEELQAQTMTLLFLQIFL